MFLCFLIVRNEALVPHLLNSPTFGFIQLKNLEETRRSLSETPLEENRKKELSSALHVYFKDWLYGKKFEINPHIKFICIIRF